MNYKTLYFMLFLFLSSCASIEISDGDEMSLVQKLYYTEWESSNKKQKIVFSQNEVKFQIGSILGTSYTSFDVLEETYDYGLYGIYEDQISTLMAILQIDSKTIHVLIGNQLLNLPQQEVRELVKQNGVLLKLKKNTLK